MGSTRVHIPVLALNAESYEGLGFRSVVKRVSLKRPRHRGALTGILELSEGQGMYKVYGLV